MRSVTAAAGSLPPVGKVPAVGDTRHSVEAVLDMPGTDALDADTGAWLARWPRRAPAATRRSRAPRHAAARGPLRARRGARAHPHPRGDIDELAHEAAGRRPRQPCSRRLSTSAAPAGARLGLQTAMLEAAVKRAAALGAARGAAGGRRLAAVSERRAWPGAEVERQELLDAVGARSPRPHTAPAAPCSSRWPSTACRSTCSRSGS